MWWFLFLTNLLVPIIMILAGVFMWKHYPSEINSLIGYRTSMSMKNIDTWRFANEHAGKLWWKWGWITLVCTVVVQLPFYHSSEDVLSTLTLVLCTLHIIVLLGSILPTERALRKNFHKDGSRIF
ncbi:MAG: SdpI family protein [Erysipelotrichaceae bacterium]|nr:SdpI family protein [Erysipelotrichaceae bacterium]